MNAIPTIPMINGVEHSWASVMFSIAGVPVAGITSIEYGDEQEMENIYGVGCEPVARGYGNIKAEANVTLLRTTIENLRAASPTGRLEDIAPFPIIVSWIPVNGQKMKNDILQNCQFLEDRVNLKQGDTKNEQTLNLIVSHIQRG